MNFLFFALTVCIVVLQIILSQKFAVEQLIANKCYGLYSAGVWYILYRVLYL